MTSPAKTCLAAPRGHPARRLLGALLLALASICLGGCLERADPELQLDPALRSQAQDWVLAGSFGGDAVAMSSDSDPWMQRFEPGGFKRVAGLQAVGGEVWVCDLGISRIQVFDEDGAFKRQYGMGVPLEPLLPSLERQHTDNALSHNDPQRWDRQHGAPWRGTHGSLFQAADLDILDGNLWLADWARTAVGDRASRSSGVRRFALPDPFLGSQESLGTPSFTDEQRLGWPTYISCGRQTIAISEPWGNTLRLYRPVDREELYRSTDISDAIQLGPIVDARVAAKGHPQYLEYLALQTGKSGAPAKFDEVRGVCVAFDKIIACDMNNSRLQVFDGQNQDEFYWGKLLRIFPARHLRGYPRFEKPLDIDASPQGDMYVLDAARGEVAVLNSEFARTGSFGRGLISVPWAIDLSDDGQHCYVSDLDGNRVHHFVRRDSEALAQTSAPGQG